MMLSAIRNLNGHDNRYLLCIISYGLSMNWETAHRSMKTKTERAHEQAKIGWCTISLKKVTADFVA